MSVNLKILLLTVAVTLAFAAAVPAVTPKEARIGSKQPINIFARTIEIDDKTGIAWYRGDVTITDGEFTLKADRVQVIMREGDIEIFKAFGDPVDVKRRSANIQQQMKARAKRATYNVITQKLDMFGTVELYQEGSELHCAEVHYDMKTGRFVGKGDKDQGRCYILMRPRNKEQRAAEKEATK